MHGFCYVVGFFSRFVLDMCVLVLCAYLFYSIWNTDNLDCENDFWHWSSRILYVLFFHHAWIACALNEASGCWCVLTVFAPLCISSYASNIEITHIFGNTIAHTYTHRLIEDTTQNIYFSLRRRRRHRRRFLPLLFSAWLASLYPCPTFKLNACMRTIAVN